MEISQDEKNAYRKFISEIENVLFYANAAWIQKHGTSLVAEEATAVPTGFSYPTVQAKLHKQLEEAEKIAANMTKEELEAFENFQMPTEMPAHLLAIPKEMRDILDTMVMNISSLAEQHRQDTIWLASARDQKIPEERLLRASKKGYHHLDFQSYWDKVEHKRQRRILLEFRGT